MFKITKQFKFDAGHRVYNQKLIDKLACDDKCVCRRLHGHEYKVDVSLYADKLDDQGMVTDFKHLNWFKKWIDNTFDHKFIFGIDDPFLPLLLKMLNDYTEDDILNIIRYNVESDKYYLLRFDSNKIPEHLSEVFTDVFYEGIVIIDYVPTAEYLSKFFTEIISNKMKEVIPSITKVEVAVWETSKSYATYISQ